MRFILFVGVLAAAVLVHAGFAQTASADGLIYQLPSDGTSVRYETEVVYSANEQERTLKGSLTISSVGQANVDNEKCRWIEFKNVMATEQGERILIAKCLIPEKDLGKGKSPGEHMIRGWIKLGDRDAQEFKEFDSQPGRDVLLGYLAGPSPNAKELDKSEVDGPLGKLACIGVTGDKDIQYGDRTMTIYFENRLHEKAPFGIVSAVWKMVVKNNGKVMGSGTSKMTLAETSTTAVTELPGKN